MSPSTLFPIKELRLMRSLANQAQLFLHQQTQLELDIPLLDGLVMKH
jgi:hypothetical protein